MSSSAVAEQIRIQVERCRSPRRQRVITERWGRTHPALEGLSIDDIQECCHRGTTEQNPIVAALIDLHQSGDADASTVLLSVCEPIIYGLTKHDTRTSRHGPRRATTTTVSDNYWAGLGHVLATIATDEPTTHDGSPKVFLAHIGCLTTHRRRQQNSSDRRRHRFEGHTDGGRFVELSDSRLAEEGSGWVDIGEVEDAVIRLIELNQIAVVVRAGLIDADKWRQLLEHRITTGTGSTNRDRVAAHRTARRLAELVGHAA